MFRILLQNLFHDFQHEFIPPVLLKVYYFVSILSTIEDSIFNLFIFILHFCVLTFVNKGLVPTVCLLIKMCDKNVVRLLHKVQDLIIYIDLRYYCYFINFLSVLVCFGNKTNNLYFAIHRLFLLTIH